MDRLSLHAGNLTTAWVSEFSTACSADVTRSGVNMSAWRKAGRKTKEYPNGQDYDYWLKAGVQHLNNYARFRDENRNLKIWTTPDTVLAPDGSRYYDDEFCLRPAIELGIMRDFPGGVPVKMFIDRIFEAPDGTLIIVDLKTGSRIPGSELQLGFYASGIELLYGTAYRPKFGSYVMTKDGEMTAPLPLDTYSPKLLGSWLSKFDAAVEQQILIPNVGDHCRSCGVSRYCVAVGGQEPDRVPES